MERETRMKKIAGRGTDRMALIQNLDPKASSFSNRPQHARSASEPHNPFLQDYIPGGDDTITSHDNASEGTTVPNDEFENEPRCALVTTTTSEASHDTKPFEYHLSSISPREIHFSIISSENTRVLCSFVIAVLVVLSHVNLPHKVIKSKSLIAYRPLYAVLLTDMLIVAGRLALYSQGKEEEEEEREAKREKDLENWDGAVKLLEWGLMMHQTLRAVFIDCSLYLAIVICGLSVLS